MPQLLCHFVHKSRTASFLSAFHCIYLLNFHLQECIEQLNVLRLLGNKLLGMFPNRLCLNPGLIDHVRNANVGPRHPSFLTQASTSGLVPKPPTHSPVYFPVQSYVPYSIPHSVLMQSTQQHSPVKPVTSALSDVREDIRADILKKINHFSQSDSPPVEKSVSPSRASPNSNRLSPTVLSKPASPSTSLKPDDKMYTSKLGKRSHQSSPKPSPKKARWEENKKRQKSPIPDNTLPSTPTCTKTDKISEAIWCYYVQQRQTEELYQKKIQLRNALYAVLKGVFPYCGLYIVGSSMSGFGTKTSDMDLCLMLSPAQIDQKKEATEILFMIHRAIRKCSFIKSPTVIRAKVPIMKFFDRISGVECDLNVNNSVGIRNTHLLRYYASMDWRVRPLMLFIKHWARFHDINDARKMTLSSYSLALMLIHYLQDGCKPPVLPCLQKVYPGHFNPNTDIRDLKLSAPLSMQKMNNSESMGDLFLGFLKYYTHEFDYKKQAISVRKGCTLQRHQMSSLDNPNQWKCFCIEEPFDCSNTARAVYDDYTFTRIYRVIRNSYQTLDQTKDVEEILKFPF
ncbi:poly(A) RNA polymerase GLD2-like [Gigantopelta aegis]|uniref:poly(A) RNA polymerase GLD2-like n=1 Tax=Gigantopelta aegis TaxID=1735272 RepID=UPI001B888F4E|nr:poly(A) RNA polymerase GLD2-like [Gigantopelta aegis]XP_041370377.1 poly(A) RNA polymerase GLD2-like [Gigantopelta aegis]